MWYWLRGASQLDKYWDNGKENGSYRDCIGLYRDYRDCIGGYIGIIGIV